MSQSVKLALVGGGNMARAIVVGAIDAGVLRADEVVVADPMAPQRRVLEKFGIRCVEHASELAPFLNQETQLMLAVKPQILAEAATDAQPLLDTSRVVISIIAGLPSARIRDLMGAGARVVRVMPNTPARVRRGMAAVALGAGAIDGDERLAEAVFDAIGDVVRIDESMMDAFTAVAGSGPAYVFYLAEAMQRAAEDLGFDAETADRIVRATVRGGGCLMSELLDHSPAELRAAVTSKGGTTAAAIDTMDSSRVMETVIDAVKAASARGAELAKV